MAGCTLQYPAIGQRANSLGGQGLVLAIVMTFSAADPKFQVGGMIKFYRFLAGDGNGLGRSLNLLISLNGTDAQGQANGDDNYCGDGFFGFHLFLPCLSGWSGSYPVPLTSW